MIPGEVLTLDGDIELNVDRPTIVLRVSNTGDRPIQIGSHYHFSETNRALAFDRAAARGFRLNIPAGTAVRFEPGQARTVELVALSGARVVYGFAGEVMGKLEGKLKGKREGKVKAAGGAKLVGKPALSKRSRIAPKQRVAAKKRARK